MTKFLPKKKMLKLKLYCNVKKRNVDFIDIINQKESLTIQQLENSVS